MNKMFPPSLIKKILWGLAISLSLLLIWRVIHAVAPANLFNNAGFENGQMAGWQVVSEGSPQAAANIGNNSVLNLSIPTSPAGSWVGIGQQVAVNPDQPYKIAVAYQWPKPKPDSATIVVRISEFDRAGQPVHAEEISLPDPPGAETAWHSFDHSFTTQANTATAEVGFALFGHQEATIAFDQLTLVQASWPVALTHDPLFTWPALLLLVGGLTYALRQFLIALFRKIIRLKILQPRSLAIIGVNLVVLFVCAELFALAVYFIRDGRFFYTTSPANLESVEAPAENSEELTDYRFHPYFGYIRASRDIQSIWENVDESLLTVNNHGLFSDRDYPFAKSQQNQFIIGIFGGSVSEEFALLYRDDLKKSLQQHPFFSDKEIVVLNFSRGGYKQPQQILVLTYFLTLGQEFDLIINIDGFNEITLGNRNNIFDVDFTMPNRGVYNTLINLTDRSTLTSDKLQTLAQIDRYKTRLNRLAQQMEQTPLASHHFILEQYAALLQRQYSQELVKFNETRSADTDNSLIFVKRNNPKTQESDLYKYIANHWVTSSITMRDLLATQNIPYYHFLQPNQYYSNKVFSQAEANIALDNEHPYYPAARAGYPELIAASETLVKNQVNFYNAVPIFDSVAEPVYRDNCCHYNELGNQILADFMAEKIINSEDFRTLVANYQVANQ